MTSPPMQTPEEVSVGGRYKGVETPERLRRNVECE
jgi:hypothetical protein